MIETSDLGEKLTLAALAERTGLSKSTIVSMVNRGKVLEKRGRGTYVRIGCGSSTEKRSTATKAVEAETDQAVSEGNASVSGPTTVTIYTTDRDGKTTERDYTLGEEAPGHKCRCGKDELILRLLTDQLEIIKRLGL